MRKEKIDRAVLQALGGDVLRPAVVNAVLDGVWQAMQPKAHGARRESRSRQG